MARPPKVGLEFFPVDVGILDSVPVRKVLNACGPQSFTVLIAILCEIYGGNGYYAKNDEDLWFLVADKIGAKTLYVSEVITKALQVGFFDAEKGYQHRILTSAQIQDDYLTATSRRKNNKDMIEDYKLINVDNNLVNVDNNATQQEFAPAITDRERVRERVRVRVTDRTLPITSNTAGARTKYSDLRKVAVTLQDEARTAAGKYGLFMASLAKLVIKDIDTLDAGEDKKLHLVGRQVWLSEYLDALQTAGSPCLHETVRRLVFADATTGIIHIDHYSRATAYSVAGMQMTRSKIKQKQAVAKLRTRQGFPQSDKTCPMRWD